MKILDSSVIICLYFEINAPEILKIWRKVGYSIKICKSVQEELQKNNKTFITVSKDLKNGAIDCMKEIEDEEIKKFRNLHPNLGIGEIETIILGIKLKKSKKRNYCVIDDGVARKVAKKYNISLTGTYGLIKRLFEKNLLSKSKFENLVKMMKKSPTFRINFNKIK